MGEATVCIDTDSAFSWFISLTRHVFHLTVSHTHTYTHYTPPLFYTSGAEERRKRRKEEEERGSILILPPVLRPPPDPPLKDSILESSVSSLSSLKQLFGREKLTDLYVVFSARSWIFLTYKGEVVFFSFFFKLQGGEGGGNWLDFLRTIAGYLADREE